METNKLSENLNQLLCSDSEVCFTYKKKNGETRKARGTKNETIIGKINEDALVKGNGDRNLSPDVIRYFDLDKEAWRSCRIDMIESIDSDEI